MRVLVYANVGLNMIDGSTIWVQSLVEVLSGQLGCRVVLLSRDRLQDRGVGPALKRLKDVRIVCYDDYPDIKAQHPDPGSPYGIEKIIRRLDSEEVLDRIIIRAPDVALQVSRTPALRQRLWAYLLDTPALDRLADRSEMRELAENAGGLIVQSDTQRGLLETVFPAACNKTSILPPMVKPVVAELPARTPYHDPQLVRFIYSGKYSAAWNVEAFFDVPDACAQEGVAAAITMIGDKVHDEPSDIGFRDRILAKFTSTPGVTWLGPMDRDAAVVEAASHDLGLCWRTSALDDSLEISTKFLEFASVGVPSVVNRTAAYESLLGEDYPYFAASIDDVVSAARAVVSDRDTHERIAKQCRKLVADFTYEQAAVRLRHALRLRKTPGRSGAKPKVLVASHDLKFLSEALRWLGDTDRYEIIEDSGASWAGEDGGRRKALLAQADVIFCEWCASHAIWYSRHKLPHQKMFIRLHRYEVFTDQPREIEIDAIDGIIVVSDHFRDLCIREYNWPADKLTVLPQYCVAEQLQRSKHPGAEKTLGLVGINAFRHKRFDRAIDILRIVRRANPDFRLRIRSAMPWQFRWLWNDLDERRRFLDAFHTLEQDKELRSAVIFDRPGSDMAEWYRNIGFILSTSESEGCHTSVAEGACSGAVPIIIDWPGAGSVYGASNVYETVEEMANAILRASASGSNASLRSERMAAAAGQFDIARTLEHLEKWFD